MRQVFLEVLTMDLMPDAGGCKTVKSPSDWATVNVSQITAIFPKKDLYGRECGAIIHVWGHSIVAYASQRDILDIILDTQPNVGYESEDSDDQGLRVLHKHTMGVLR